MAENEDVRRLRGFVDLHTHTTESDGTLTPEELARLASEIGLDALAVTDHDTVAGFEKAAAAAQGTGLQVVRGIELNSRLNLAEGGHRAAHLLGYFPCGEPLGGFVQWLEEQCRERSRRNEKLVESLRDRGVEITLEEVETRGKALAGRVHFARVLVDKGYAADIENAFRKLLGEDAPSFVDRQSYTAEETVRMIRSGGGIPVVAHPIRLSLDQATERRVFERLRKAGLAGLEVYHSEHSPRAQTHYRRLAEELELIPTGGSDFHGRVKPGTELGRGVKDNIRVPREFLERLREFARRTESGPAPRRAGEKRLPT
ncbi:MAG: PHP domain-containing protein [Bryobacteraceae bacterium]